VKSQKAGKGKWSRLRGWLLPVLLISLLAGCAPRVSYPPFPFPSDALQEWLDVQAEERKKAGNPDLWEWGQRLRILCVQLGDCGE
jgi:hypothetical protein